MATTKSGFNEAEMKLVRLFDSPNRPEAVNAFNKTMDRLAKDNRKFVEQFANPSEAEILRGNLAEMREQLSDAFAKLVAGEAEKADLLETLDRMRERVVQLESGTPEPDIPNPDDMPPFDTEPDELPPFDDEPNELPPFPMVVNPPRGMIVTGNTAAALPSTLTLGPALYWLALLLFVGFYAGRSYVVGHFLTADDWSHAAYLFAFVVPVLAVMSYGTLRIFGFYQSSVGRAFASIGSGKAMGSGLFVVAALWFLTYLNLPKAQTPDSNQVLVTIGFGLALFSLVYIARYELQRWGWPGLLLQIFLLVDLYSVGILVEFHRLPWNLFHTPLLQPVYSPVVAVLGFFVVALLLLSDQAIAWLLASETLHKLVIYPAIAVIVLCVAVYVDHAHAARPVAPSNAVVKPSALSVSSAPVLLRMSYTQTETAAPVEPAASTPSDFTWKGWAALIVAGIVVLIFIGNRLEKRRRDKAYDTAHAFVAENVHGAAGYAKADDAKKGGWL